MHKKTYGLIQSGRLPGASICDHDFNAAELLRVLQEHNIKVSIEVPVLSSGNTEVSAFSLPALTPMDLLAETVPLPQQLLVLFVLQQPGKQTLTQLPNGFFEGLILGFFEQL